ncbi:uncharacterized protein LOC114273079 [Camellia sinensis]|uniref:uncharacterized protein LOC114273079 n=1 Tax=Camellia sinensis TaxID=4442 RepID=UPI00103695D2|nr:uncharacterized protein LOC114273079 [Camellia sinensis]
MDPKKSRKSDDDVVAIIQCYNEKTKAFTVRKKNLTFTTNDMTLIFGLEGGKGAMSLRYSKKPKSAFLRRRFQKDTRLTGPVLKNALVKAMKGKQPTGFKDVAIIVTLYLCLTLFFATSGNSIGWVFIKYVEPLESMKQYDWPEAITSTLIDSIMALHKTLEKVMGCVIALLYWLCEHATIIDSEDSNTTDFPRCAKWILQTLTKQLQKTPVHSLAPRQIDNKQLVKNPSEEFCLGKKTKKELKKAIVKFKETLQDPSEDGGNEQAEGNTEEYEASNGQEHQASSTEEETSEESEEIEPEDKEQNEQKEEDSEQEDEEEDEQQEENKDESDEEENNEPMDQQYDGICGSTIHQPEEFEESKDAQIADLCQRLKALSQSKKEEDRNWIELLAEKDISIRIMTSHNSELQEKESTIRMKLRMLEVEKADDTKTIQQLREISLFLLFSLSTVKKDPTSMIKNLKAKERKEKQHDPEFQYPKVAKVTRASKQAAKQVKQSTKDKEVLDADAYVLPQPINIRKSWAMSLQGVRLQIQILHVIISKFNSTCIASFHIGQLFLRRHSSTICGLLLSSLLAFTITSGTSPTSWDNFSEGSTSGDTLQEIPLQGITLWEILVLEVLLQKWAVELGQFDIKFQPRTAIIAQALADFVTEFTPGSHHICPVDLTSTTEMGTESAAGIAQPLIQDTSPQCKPNRLKDQKEGINQAIPNEDSSISHNLGQTDSEEQTPTEGVNLEENISNTHDPKTSSNPSTCW